METFSSANTGSGTDEIGMAGTADPLLDRLMVRIDRLMDAVSMERIADANLAQVTTALGTLIDRAERLRERMPMAEMSGSERDHLATILRRHVHDPKVRAAIAAEMDAAVG